MSKGQREMTYEELKYAYMKKVQRLQELEDELIVQKEYFEELQNNHIRVCNQNKRYREALEFYSDIELYDEYDHPELGLTTDVNIDKGNKARKVLEG